MSPSRAPCRTHPGHPRTAAAWLAKLAGISTTASLAPTSSAHSSMELLEARLGHAADAPLCANCGTKMRPAGSCYVCEGCGSTSGCS